MTAALEAGRHDPDLVAVEARRHLTTAATAAVVLPAALPAAARADTTRTPPSLLGYDDLLDDALLTGKATA
jgi:hypothetical protein